MLKKKSFLLLVSCFSFSIFGITFSGNCAGRSLNDENPSVPSSSCTKTVSREELYLQLAEEKFTIVQRFRASKEPAYGFALLGKYLEIENFLRTHSDVTQAYNAPLPKEIEEKFNEQMDTHLGSLKGQTHETSLSGIIKSCGLRIKDIKGSAEGLFKGILSKWDPNFLENLIIAQLNPRSSFLPVVYPEIGQSILPVPFLGVATLLGYFPIAFSQACSHAHGVDGVSPGALAKHDIAHGSLALFNLYPLSRTTTYKDRNLSDHQLAANDTKGFLDFFYTHVWLATASGIATFLESDKSETEKTQLMFGLFAWVHESDMTVGLKDLMTSNCSLSSVFQTIKKQYTNPLQIIDPDVDLEIEKTFKGEVTLNDCVTYFFNEMIRYGQKEDVHKRFQEKSKKILEALPQDLRILSQQL